MPLCSLSRQIHLEYLILPSHVPGHWRALGSRSSLHLHPHLTTNLCFFSCHPSSTKYSNLFFFYHPGMANLQPPWWPTPPTSTNPSSLLIPHKETNLPCPPFPCPTHPDINSSPLITKYYPGLPNFKHILSSVSYKIPPVNFCRLLKFHQNPPLPLSPHHLATAPTQKHVPTCSIPCWLGILHLVRKLSVWNVMLLTLKKQIRCCWNIWMSTGPLVL